MMGTKLSMGSDNRPFSVVVNKINLPMSAPDDYSSGAFCVKMSPEWFSIMQGVMEHLSIRAMWRYNTNEEWANVKDWLNQFARLPRECVVIPPPPPPPPPPPIETGGSGGDTVGSMGYTIEELEEILQMAITKIEWRNGQLWYRDGCCDWYPVIGMSAPVAQIGSISNAEKTADKLMQDILDGLSADLPSLPPIQPPSQHTTADSIRCSKATAIQDGIFITQGQVKEMLELLPIGEVTLTGAVTVVTAVIATAGWAAVIAFAATLVSALAGEVAEDVVNEITADTNNTLLRTAYICDLIPRLSDGTEITGNDVAAAIDVWRDTFAPSSPLSTIIGAFPVGYLRDNWQQYVSQTPCACEEYMPYNYEPPLPENGFRFQIDRLFKTANANGAVIYPQDHTAFANIDTLSGMDGALSGEYPVTELVADDSGYWWHEFAALIELSEPANVNNVKLSVVYPAGETQNGNGVGAHLAYFDSGTGFWERISAVSDTSTPYATEFNLAIGVANITHIALMFYVQSNNASAAKTARAVSIRMSGTYSGGNSFTELELNEISTP